MPRGQLKRYSAKNTVKPVTFFFDETRASRVSLVGSFNNWDPEAQPMTEGPDGTWQLQIELTHGHHHYLFLVDGEYKLDSRAPGRVRVEGGGEVSLILVS